MRSIGSRIKELRKKRGYTQEQLAQKVNVSPQVISNWERHYSSLDDEDISSLVLALETTADYLLGKDITSGVIEDDTEEAKNKNELHSIINKTNDPDLIKLLLEVSKKMQAK